jgi:hypothetical protein
MESLNLRSFIHDVKWFVLYNRLMIKVTPLQTYYSALIFTPEDSIVRKQFENDIPKWICQKPTVQANWSVTLQTLEGHSFWVNPVAVSADGKLVDSAHWVRRKVSFLHLRLVMPSGEPCRLRRRCKRTRRWWYVCQDAVIRMFRALRTSCPNWDLVLAGIWGFDSSSKSLTRPGAWSKHAS